MKKIIYVSKSETHHTFSDDTPCYEARYDNVLPFHDVNSDLALAPVMRNNQAWHILSDGVDAYSHRFERTFGFYCGYAAIIHNDQYFHITANGQPLYQERYLFAGNYQNDIAVVCNEDKEYFHINCQGIPLYENTWSYCGDFREGAAVAQLSTGKNVHIRKDGSLLHDKNFLDLDVFHKGYARAKNKTGWYHIDRQGNAIYPARYESIENFYNGRARVEHFNGSVFTIDEKGSKLHTLRTPIVSPFESLSNDMVGYWKTFTIAAGVQLGLFESLPARANSLSKACHCKEKLLLRLLNALAELELVICTNEVWSTSTKGSFLSLTHPQSLASAALEYSTDLLDRWKQLPDLIKGDTPNSQIFQIVANNPKRAVDHHKMLSAYALNDYKSIVPLFNINPKNTVFDAGGGRGTLAQMLKREYPHAKVILGDLPAIIQTTNFKDTLAFDFFKPWQIQPDKIILARILHEWPDDKAVLILKNAAQALRPGGELYIIEMLISNDSFVGSLCDLHLLSVTGGQKRTQNEIEQLALDEEVGLTFSKCSSNFNHSITSLLCFQKKEIS